MTALVLASERLAGSFELLDQALLPVAEGMFAPFRIGEANVTPGEYQLRLRLTDGRVLRHRMELSEEPYILRADDLAEAEQLGEAAMRAAQRLGSLATSATDEAVSAPEGVDVTIKLLWAGPDPYESDAGLWFSSGDGDIDYRFRRRLIYGYEAPLAVEVASTKDHEGLPIVTLILPRFAVGLDVTLRTGGEEPIIRATVDSPELQALLDILAASAPSAPTIVQEVLMNSFSNDAELRSSVDTLAYEFAKDKFNNPDLAAAAGWYLLKIRKLDLIRDWPRNLSDYFLYLPDGAVLEGWRRLIQGKEGNTPYPKWRLDDPPPKTPLRPEPNARRPDNPLEDAAIRFTEAAHRGPPYFAVGVERLASGLDWCVRRLAQHERPNGLLEARELARIWTDALVSGTSLTAFRGGTDALNITAQTVRTGFLTRDNSGRAS